MSDTKLGGIIKRGGPQGASGNATYAPNAPSGRKTLLGAHLAEGPRGLIVEDTAIGRVRIEMLGARDDQEIEAATLKAIQGLGLDSGSPTRAATRYEMERATRTLAQAVRDPDDRTLAFGSLEEWQALGADVVASVWQNFGDVRDQLDPSPLVALNEIEDAMLGEAVKRGDSAAIQSYGSKRVAAWMIAHADDLLARSEANKKASES